MAKKTTVIGSGFGGLAAALRLRAKLTRMKNSKKMLKTF